MTIERIKPEYEILDERFSTYLLANVKLKKLASGFDWAEGPVWMGDSGFLLFSDIPNNKVYRWHEEMGLSTYLAPSNFANGHYRDLQGRLISCEHGSRSITRMEHDGRVKVIAQKYKGKKLNSPNDVVVKSDGSVWFTDPYYGIITNYEGHKAEPELPGAIYRLDPSNSSLRCVSTVLDCPNGLAFSPGEDYLYVSETGLRHDPHAKTGLYRFKVFVNQKISKSFEYLEIDAGVPDGFRLDTDGNIWTSAGDGVHCISPDFKLLGKIYIPEVVSNVCFGGRAKQTLYITATNSIYSIALNREGIQTP